jgi:hypothetical protein
MLLIIKLSGSVFLPNFIQIGQPGQNSITLQKKKAVGFHLELNLKIREKG